MSVNQKYAIIQMEGITMSKLDGFKRVQLVVGSPYLTVSKYGISFNKSVLSQLEYPEYVLILEKTQDKQLAIKVAGTEEEGVQKFSKSKQTLNVRWNNREYTKKLLHWGPNDYQAVGFKVPGEYLEEDNAMFFDFSRAEPI